MNKELEAAIETLEKEKNIKRDILFEAIENALMTACKSNFGKADNIEAGVRLAREAIDSGAALEQLNKLIEYTNRG